MPFSSILATWRPAPQSRRRAALAIAARKVASPSAPPVSPSPVSPPSNPCWYGTGLNPCFCENFYNGLTTDRVCEKACAKDETAGLKGAVTKCFEPIRPFIPHVDSGCPVDTKLCIVQHNPPQLDPCNCNRRARSRIQSHTHRTLRTTTWKSGNPAAAGQPVWSHARSRPASQLGEREWGRQVVVRVLKGGAGPQDLPPAQLRLGQEHRRFGQLRLSRGHEPVPALVLRRGEGCATRSAPPSQQPQPGTHTYRVATAKHALFRRCMIAC
jgi:hypothetical protein